MKTIAELMFVDVIHLERKLYSYFYEIKFGNDNIINSFSSYFEDRKLIETNQSKANKLYINFNFSTPIYEQHKVTVILKIPEEMNKN